MKLLKHCLTVAGSDPSGGAGIGADIKTFSALDCYAMSVITSVVAENTFTVKGKADITAEMITAQLEA
ncbi:MAG: bifunctional hydroxymethylpyrimidine kinase/phosphomethylpyrimidine kinase, partial [Ruminiclostridium sp.]